MKCNQRWSPFIKVLIRSFWGAKNPAKVENHFPFIIIKQSQSAVEQLLLLWIRDWGLACHMAKKLCCFHQLIVACCESFSLPWSLNNQLMTINWLFCAARKCKTDLMIANMLIRFRVHSDFILPFGQLTA